MSVHYAEDGCVPVIADDAGWITIDTAPRDGTAIQARIPGHGDDNMIGFHYIGDCGSEEGGAAYGWTFVTDQEPPDDWTDGYCWAVNDAGNQSTLPTHWKPAKSIQNGYEAAGEVSPNLKAKAQGEGGQKKTPPCTAGLPEVAKQNCPEAQSSTPSGTKIRTDEPFTQAIPHDKIRTPTTPPDGEGRHD